MSDKNNALTLEYPWLSIQTTVEEYMNPDYYNKILRDYIFDNKSDLEIFRQWLEPLVKKDDLSILELGCGSGRVTKVALDAARNTIVTMDLVDLSKQMLSFTENQLKEYGDLKFINSDTVEFLQQNEAEYDIIFSLWSFSHSVHQILTRDGVESGKKYIQTAIKNMIFNNMKPESELFLIHFDSLSDEQTILLRQWSKVFPIFDNLDLQSPSKIIIDDVLEKLGNERIIQYEVEHFIGSEIIYSSQEDALEVFMNFHMQSFFNDSVYLPEVLGELIEYFNKFTDDTGKVKIKPGCFIYKVRRLKND